jgi:hypothetical protein
MGRLRDIRDQHKREAPKGQDNVAGVAGSPKLPGPEAEVRAGARTGPSEHYTGIVARECEERREFDAAQHLILDGTAPRFHLGTVLTRDLLCAAAEQGGNGEIGASSNLEGMAPYIVNLGPRPKQARGRLSVVGDTKPGKPKEEDTASRFYRMIFEAHEQIRPFALPKGTGPFADVDGAMAAYADALFNGPVPAGAPEALFDMIERVIDSRPMLDQRMEAIDPRFFGTARHVYNFGIETPDDPINASLILTTVSRISRDEVSHGLTLSITHPWEPYLIGVAALRARGVPAYLTQLIIPYRPGEEVPIYLQHDALETRVGSKPALAAPAIAIIDPAADTAMRLFRMSRHFPAFGAVDILSDTAAEGAAFAIRAEMRVKHLAFEMMRRAASGIETLSETEFQTGLARVARCLFESIKRWDGNPLVSRVLNGVQSGVQEGAFMFAIAKYGSEAPSGLTISVSEAARTLLSHDSLAAFEPQNGIQAAAKQLAAYAIDAGTAAAETMQTVLGSWITQADLRKAALEKPEK